MPGNRLETMCLWVAGISVTAFILLGQRETPSKWQFIALAPGLIAALILMAFDMRRRWSELRALRDGMPPGRFWSMVLGTVLFIMGYTGASMWLKDRIGWPERYGFSCNGRGCWLSDLRYSSRLLEAGSGEEWALFLLMWTLPAMLIVAAVYVLIKRTHSRR